MASAAEVGRVVPDENPDVLAFSPDRKYLATSSYEQTRVWSAWDTKTPRQIGRFESSRISPGAAFTPDGRYLTTLDAGENDSRDARVWDLESGREVARVSHSDQVSFTGFRPGWTVPPH